MISAIVLAAGASKRMGQPKLLMQWGATTVLEQVISVFSAAGIDDILLVTGSYRYQVEEMIARLQKPYAVRTIFNEAHETGEMLSSIQCGLNDLLDKTSDAALIGLGDQPQIEESTVRLICDAYQESGRQLIVPSHQMRRGHPWMVGRGLWPKLLDLRPPQTPRYFLTSHIGFIKYVEVGTPTIFADLDTPDDYRESHPRGKGYTSP